ncbi:MAG: hypothetical protein ACKPFD_04990 [Dolichospermum sp.]
MSKSQYQTHLKNSLAKRFGETLANKLAMLEKVQTLYTWYLSRKLDTPGRLYSFLAVKPL